MRWPCCVRLYKNAALGTRSHSTRIIKTQSNTSVLDQTGPFCRVGGDELGTVSFFSGVSLAWALQKNSPMYASSILKGKTNFMKTWWKYFSQHTCNKFDSNSYEIDFPYKQNQFHSPYCKMNYTVKLIRFNKLCLQWIIFACPWCFVIIIFDYTYNWIFLQFSLNISLVALNAVPVIYSSHKLWFCFAPPNRLWILTHFRRMDSVWRWRALE